LVLVSFLYGTLHSYPISSNHSCEMLESFMAVELILSINYLKGTLGHE